MKSAVIDQGLELWTDDTGGVWSFENCTCAPKRHSKKRGSPSRNNTYRDFSRRTEKVPREILCRGAEGRPENKNLPQITPFDLTRERV